MNDVPCVKPLRRNLISPHEHVDFKLLATKIIEKLQKQNRGKLLSGFDFSSFIRTIIMNDIILNFCPDNKLFILKIINKIAKFKTLNSENIPSDKLS